MKTLTAHIIRTSFTASRFQTSFRVEGMPLIDSFPINWNITNEAVELLLSEDLAFILSDPEESTPVPRLTADARGTGNRQAGHWRGR